MAIPTVTVKIASSLDGKIALENGQSQWITGEEARAKGRELRGTHEAIAIGSNTAIYDNPRLTTRIPDAPNPIRVVFDSWLKLPPDSHLAITAKEVPVWLFCRSGLRKRAEVLEKLGVKIIPISHTHSGLNIKDALEHLEAENVKSLLVEGGGALVASFMANDCVDEIHWFRASKILGGDARSSVGHLSLEVLEKAPSFKRIAAELIGDDLHEHYKRV